MITHLALDIPGNDSFDVIVVGGGPSGCAAATAAAPERRSHLADRGLRLPRGLRHLGAGPEISK
jgi:predicted flavoprotein YhiN